MRHIILSGVALAMAASLAAGQTPRKQTNPRPIVRRPPAPWATLSPGYNQRVKVFFPARLDWTFPLPADVDAKTPGHVPASTIYQLFIPAGYRHNQPHALILFVPSDSTAPNEYLALSAVCRKYHVLFACPYGAGNDCAPALRTRLAVEVLEDVRQRFNVDTDRTYVAGFSGGARVASDIAFAYPEYVGGLMAVGGLGGLRNEGWLRDRVRDRLSVAVAHGDSDPVRGEVERWRLPVLREVGVKAKAWVAPRTGHAMPPTAQLEEMFVWLEAGRAERLKLALAFPTSRAANGTAPSAELWAAGVVEEAARRLEDRKLRESGLSQLDGVLARWEQTQAAKKAKKLLDGQPGWRKAVGANQQRFLYLEARGLDAYLSALPQTEQAREPLLLKASLARWEAVRKLDEASKEGKEAVKRTAELRRLVEEK